MPNDQGSEAWFRARVGVCTASRFADIMAKIDTAAYKNYLLQIATERLTGVSQAPTFVNEAMEHGTLCEPLAKAAYETHTGDLIAECSLFIHGAYPFVGASPDGLIGADRLVEIKCPKSTTHVEYLKERTLPPKYKPQVQGQLWVTGRQYAHFVSFDPRVPAHLQLLVVDVKRDESYIEKLQMAALEFNVKVEGLLAELREDRWSKG